MCFSCRRRTLPPCLTKDGQTGCEPVYSGITSATTAGSVKVTVTRDSTSAEDLLTAPRAPNNDQTLDYLPTLPPSSKGSKATRGLAPGGALHGQGRPPASPELPSGREETCLTDLAQRTGIWKFDLASLNLCIEEAATGKSIEDSKVPLRASTPISEGEEVRKLRGAGTSEREERTTGCNMIACEGAQGLGSSPECLESTIRATSAEKD